MSNTPKNFTQAHHVLVIDDDTRIRELVGRYLAGQDFVVMEAADTCEARTILERFAFDALIVDVMMPGEDGYTFTKNLRAEGVNTPVLLLTALGETDDRITGFEAGADDYLPKPFEPRELVLRLEAIMRRTAKKGVELESIQIGPWHFDPAIDVLEGEGESLKLTPVEAALLRTLATHHGEPVSRDILAEACGVQGEGRAIDVQVTRLRKKLGEDSKLPRYLQTVRGKGYKLRSTSI